MDNLTRYAEAIDNDEPILIDGFQLYPIYVRDYRRFEAAKNALLIRQGSLPVKYAVKRYLSALFEMDRDAYDETGQSLGFIAGTITILALALRLPVDVVVRAAQIKVNEANESELISIEFTVGDTLYRLTPELFDRMRPILAAQNGLELPDETENADLVEAEADIAAKNTVNVDVNFETLLASVARDQRCRRADLMEYTIREFFGLKDAIERDKMFTIYQTAELSGQVKFTKGNPCPSWCYDRKEKATSLISMRDFMAGPGSVANMR